MPPKEMQLFVMKNVPKNRLAEEEEILKEEGCINVGHQLENGNYTITALCPRRDDVQDDTE